MSETKTDLGGPELPFAPLSPWEGASPPLEKFLGQRCRDLSCPVLPIDTVSEGPGPMSTRADSLQPFQASAHTKAVGAPAHVSAYRLSWPVTTGLIDPWGEDCQIKGVSLT